MAERTTQDPRAKRNVVLARVLLGLIVLGVAVAVPAFLSTSSAEQVGPNVMGLNCDNDVDLSTAVADGESCALNTGVSGALSALVLMASVAGLGFFVVRRQPTNSTGLILILVALLFPWTAIAEYVADWVLVRGEMPVWFGVTVVLLASPAIPMAFFFVGLFLMLFPNGDFVNRWWRWVARVVATAAVVVLATGVFHPEFFSSDLADVKFHYAPGVSNPLAIDAIPIETYDTVFDYAIIPLLGGMLAGVLSLIHRFWRSTGEERQQLKVVAFAVGSFAVFALAMANLNPLGGVFSWIWDNYLIFLILMLFPAFAVALLKYRLYDVDVVINKTLVYVSLVALIAVVFGAIAFVPFLLIGVDEADTGGQLVLPFLATLAVVVLVQPARDRLQKLANRVVYGRRASPYEALSRFSASVAESAADEELLDEMATILAEGTGAEEAHVWVVQEKALRSAASFPSSAPTIEISMPASGLPQIPGPDYVSPVVHKGKLLGALTVSKSPGDPLRPIEMRLVADLASQAGVVLRNFTLTEELLVRVEQLRLSRQRLVSAQDDERRRLERDLHDGAQQQLVALKIKLGMLATIEDKELQREILESLKKETDDAIDGLRDLARGIFPPMLADEGLIKALRSQVAKAAIPVLVQSEGLERFSPEVEAAVYFCTLEALQNTAKYANASQAIVELAGEAGKLAFAISDDGVGFDAAEIQRGSGLQNMRDRVEALGGDLEIVSAVGAGTTISGWVPVGHPDRQATRTGAAGVRSEWQTRIEARAGRALPTPP